jgi:hypothetical protein
MKSFLSPPASRLALKVVAFIAIMMGAAVPARAAQGVLDYNVFMSTIQALLLTRQYNSPSPGTTCFSCHGSTTNAGYDAYPLYEGRPRDNFISTAREVTLSEPDTSLLLLKPLAIAAGGVPHGLFGNDAGDQFQNTTNDTAYSAIRDWILDATVSSVGARVTRTEPYPNPFRFSTNIVYILSTEARDVKVTIYTTSGHTIRSFDGTGLVGANRVTWDGRDKDDEPLPTGIYFYTVKATFPDGTAVKSGKCVYTP